MVVVVVLAPIVLVAVILVTILIPLRRRSQRVQAALAADVAGQVIVRGPVRSMYLGGTGRFSVTTAMGTIVLTDQRIVFRAVIGPTVVVELGDVIVVAQHSSATRRRRLMPGQSFLRVTTANGMFGVDLEDPAGWVRAIEAARPIRD